MEIALRVEVSDISVEFSTLAVKVICESAELVNFMVKIETKRGHHLHV